MSRIIIIENSGKVNFGGGQKITLQVAEILSKTCELVFVDFAKGTRFEQMINEKFPDSSKVLLKGRSFFFPFKYLNWLLDLVVLTCLFPGNLRKIKYYVTKKTLIYVTTKKGLLYAYMMKVMYGVPFIYHAHLVENTKSIFYFLYRSCLKKAEMSLCVSKAVYDTIKLPNKILLYNPNINDKGFKGRKNKDKFVVAAMGSLIKIKGFEYYIKAADKVSEKLPVEFRLYGEGPLHDTLETLSNGKVKFMGFSENIMNELYESIDIVVVPTIIPEALPLVLVEAKSVGLPAIVTNLGGQAEIIRNGIDGFLVPVGDSLSIKQYIEMMVKDRVLYNKLAEESYQSVSLFDYDLFTSTILKIFIV